MGAAPPPDLFGNVLSQSVDFWRGNEGSNDAPSTWKKRFPDGVLALAGAMGGK